MGFERVHCRSVSQEVLNEPSGKLPHGKCTAGRPVERAQSQGDSVLSGGSLQDSEADFDRSPAARLRPSSTKTRYSRKFSDPQPLGSFPLHVSDVCGAIWCDLTTKATLNHSSHSCTQLSKTNPNPKMYFHVVLFVL